VNNGGSNADMEGNEPNSTPVFQQPDSYAKSNEFSPATIYFMETGVVSMINDKQNWGRLLHLPLLGS
jgi:hypothetical protein